MVWSEGLSSSDSQSNSGLAAWRIIMGGGPHGGTRRSRDATLYYAMNPRGVGGVVEKSCRLSFAGQSFGEERRSRGEGSAIPHAEPLFCSSSRSATDSSPGQNWIFSNLGFTIHSPERSTSPHRWPIHTAIASSE